MQCAVGSGQTVEIQRREDKGRRLAVTEFEACSSLGPRASRPHAAQAGPCRVRSLLFTGTAGVPPASSSEFTQGTVESFNPGDLAFNEAGGTPAVPVKSRPLISHLCPLTSVL